VSNPKSAERFRTEPGKPRAGRGAERTGCGHVGAEQLTISLVFHPGAGNAPFRRFTEAQEKGAGDGLLQQLALLAPAHKAHDASIIPEILQVVMYQLQNFV